MCESNHWAEAVWPCFLLLLESVHELVIPVSSKIVVFLPTNLFPIDWKRGNLTRIAYTGILYLAGQDSLGTRSPRSLPGSKERHVYLSDVGVEYYFYCSVVPRREIFASTKKKDKH